MMMREQRLKDNSSFIKTNEIFQNYSNGEDSDEKIKKDTKREPIVLEVMRTNVN